jgi:shikimate dehydrogenase
MIKAAVLGRPVSHSLSPLVHTSIYQELGLQSDYQRFELDVVSGKEFLSRELDGSWSGFSLTMPLKEIGFELELEIDGDAERAHSINTISRDRGFNTDISGLARVLLLEGLEMSDVIILGSGATARSSLVALERVGYRGKISVIRRSAARDSYLPRIEASDLQLMDFDSWRLGRETAKRLLISTLPGSAQSQVSREILGFEGTLLDFSYSPWPSVLAGVASGKLISGIKVLVSQAVDQAAIFTKTEFDRDGMYEKVLSSTVRNLTS